ncbi:paired amphipathic helix [Gymnopilus junonius]|uniref:Paired amphipathic helix n=1 Tax=Gymnopilus junonius TaxID=109634 RepID=A0A9P5NJR6_GYMJU|nr:paired amphipathic helix [Gymnopilus junonius]
MASQNSPTPDALVTVDDALAYINTIKARLKSTPGAYDNFLNILRQLKDSKIDILDATQRVCQLFKGHPDLIQQFSIFLPPDYRMEISGMNPRGVELITIITPDGATLSSNDNGPDGALTWSTAIAGMKRPHSTIS